MIGGFCTEQVVPSPRALQIFVPSAKHLPAAPLSHFWPASKSSSVMPSQSLSLPSQISVAGVTGFVHARLAPPFPSARHSWTPNLHSPTQALPPTSQPTV